MMLSQAGHANQERWARYRWVGQLEQERIAATITNIYGSVGRDCNILEVVKIHTKNIPVRLASCGLNYSQSEG